MSNSKSSIPAALDHFCQLVSSLPELAGVQVVQGDIGPEIERESVVVAPIVIINDEWVNVGCRTREERWEATVFVTVARPGDVGTEARDRAFQIVDAIATAQKSSANEIAAGGAVLWGAFRRKRYAAFAEQDGGVAAQIECSIEGTARY